MLLHVVVTQRIRNFIVFPAAGVSQLTVESSDPNHEIYFSWSQKTLSLGSLPSVGVSILSTQFRIPPQALMYITFYVLLACVVRESMMS
jgi:hypothetical protein